MTLKEHARNNFRILKLTRLSFYGISSLTIWSIYHKCYSYFVHIPNLPFKIITLTGIFIISLHHPFGWCRSSISDLEARIEHLENKLESNLNLEVTNKLDSLQREMQELRGALEEQQHTATTNPINNNPIKPNQTINPTASVPTKEQQYSAKLNPTLESENTAYNAAYKLVEDKNFSEAITAFKDFLWQYNNSKYIPNATYWLGELYLTEHKFDTAANYFLQVVNKYKDHAKAPDALLKLGMLEIERENWQEAKNYFMQIKNNYPNSSRVHMAEAKIQSLDREGH